MGYIEEIRELVGHRPLILVGALVIVVNEKKEILLQQRTSPYGIWGIPGGLMELGESVEETGRRELFEETGITVGKLNLIDIFSGSEYFVKCANGDEFYSVTMAYYSDEIINGKLINNEEEALELRYFKIDEIPTEMVKSHRKIIEVFRNILVNGN